MKTGFGRGLVLETSRLYLIRAWQCRESSSRSSDRLDFFSTGLALLSVALWLMGRCVPAGYAPYWKGCGQLLNGYRTTRSAETVSQFFLNLVSADFMPTCLHVVV